MSVHLTSPIWRLDLPSVPKLVLLKFGDNASDEGYAWPSIARVARETGLNARTVQNHLRRFEADGVLAARRGGKGGRAPDDEEGKRRGATTRYFIDIERAKDLYRRGGQGYGAGLPGGVGGAAGEDEQENPKGESPAPLETDPKGESQYAKGESDDAKGESQYRPSIEEPSSEPSSERARARATGPRSGPDARALEHPSSPGRRSGVGMGRLDQPPCAPTPGAACAVWRDNLDKLQALPGWPLLERAIPDEDDGETLTLAVEVPLMGFAILAWAAASAEAVLARRLACRVRRWVEPALIERGVIKSGIWCVTAHRRDGELVSLDDPAWRLWCAHAAEIEALPAAEALVQCYPDDLDQNGLHLATDDMGIRMALHEDAGAQAAEVLGVPVVVQTFWFLGRIRAARAAWAAGERKREAGSGSGPAGGGAQPKEAAGT